MAEAPCTSLYEKGLEDLGDEITCPICQDHFQEPKILPCLHYYCKECIRNLARRHHPFPCPECRRNTTLPQNDPDQLPTAFFVNRMKELHTKMEKADGKVKAICELCSGEEAEAFCRQCTSFICADCMRSHKKMKKTFAGHQVVTLVELKQGGARQIPINEVPPTLCKEHDEPMKIFCFDCNRLICRDCVIDGHTDHKREFIKKYAVQCRSMVTESLTPLKQIQADMKQCTKTIESTETDVSTQHATVSKTIRQSFAKIVSVLKQREHQLLDQASEMRDQKLDALGAQKKNLQIVQAESQSLIEFVEHSLEGATDEEVISIYQQILPRVGEESKRHKQISLLPTTGGKLAVEISYNSDGLLKIGRVYNTPPGGFQQAYSNLSPDALALLEKNSEEEMLGVSYYTKAGRVQIEGQSKSELEDRISWFQSAYQSILTPRRLKAEPVSVPPALDDAQVTSIVASFNDKSNQCVFVYHEGPPRMIKVVSVNSCQFNQAKKLLMEALSCPPTTAPASFPTLEVISFANGRRLTLKKADIVHENVDVIVTATNESLQHGGGVGDALDRASHGSMQRYSDAYVNRNGLVPVGDVAVTHSGGALKCKVVFHAVGPTSAYAPSECKRLIARVINESLTKAEKHNFTSIAIPAICSGLFGVSKELVASCVIDSIISHKFSKAVPVLSDIRIVIIDEATYSCFARHFDKRKAQLLRQLQVAPKQPPEPPSGSPMGN